jgi:hypothetical protein
MFVSGCALMLCALLFLSIADNGFLTTNRCFISPYTGTIFCRLWLTTLRSIVAIVQTLTIPKTVSLFVSLNAKRRGIPIPTIGHGIRILWYDEQCRILTCAHVDLPNSY